MPFADVCSLAGVTSIYGLLNSAAETYAGCEL